MGSFLVFLAILGSLFISLTIGAGILSLFFIFIQYLPKQ